MAALASTAQPLAAARVASARPAATLAARPAPRAPLCLARRVNQRAQKLVVAAAEPEVAAEAPVEEADKDFIPVVKPEDLPKGVRKEIQINGRNILLFWYRNEIFATEARSPAEGAYSEGFIKAKFTQDYCIECPSTGSTFSLKDGSIQEWYPNNQVMRMLTPKETCRPLVIYPVKLTSEAICVSVDGAGGAALGKGGMGTSLENNNVFAVEPKVYVDGQDPSTAEDAEAGAIKIDAGSAATAIISLLGAGIIGVAGTATALYYEDIPLLVGFWVVFAAGGFLVAKPLFSDE